MIVLLTYKHKEEEENKKDSAKSCPTLATRPQAPLSRGFKNIGVVLPFPSPGVTYKYKAVTKHAS